MQNLETALLVHAWDNKISVLVIIIIIIINEKKLTWRLVPRNCKDTEHTIKRRRVQYSTVLVERRNCAISMTWQTSTSSNAA